MPPNDKTYYCDYHFGSGIQTIFKDANMFGMLILGEVSLSEG